MIRVVNVRSLKMIEHEGKVFLTPHAAHCFRMRPQRSCAASNWMPSPEGEEVSQPSTAAVACVALIPFWAWGLIRLESILGLCNHLGPWPVQEQESDTVVDSYHSRCGD